MKKHQEHILAIPADKILHDDQALRLIDGRIESSDVIVAQRAMLEQNEAYRQIIPYTLLRYDNKFAAYRRTPKGNESRLHGMVSIGFGGHVDLGDLVFDTANSVVDIEKTIQLAAEREINEELDMDAEVNIIKETTLKGKIVSNLSPVDRVHIGLVTVIDIDSDNVKAAEEKLNFIGFHTIEALLDLEPLEAWTEGLLKSFVNNDDLASL